MRGDRLSARLRCGEVFAQGVAETKKRVDEQIGSGKPERAAPVGVAALDIHLGFTGFVADSALAEAEGIVFMELRKAAQTKGGEKFLRVGHAREQARELSGSCDG